MVSSMSSGFAVAQVVMYRYRDFFRTTSWESDAAHVITCTCGASLGARRDLVCATAMPRTIKTLPSVLPRGDEAGASQTLQVRRGA